MSVLAGSMPVLTRMVAARLDSSLQGARVGLSGHDEATSVLAEVLEGSGAVVVELDAAEIAVETGPGATAGAPPALVSTTASTASAFAHADFPVVACHAAECVRLAVRSQGRRIVQDALRLTNRRMPGTRCAVTGYGEVARSIAAAVTALGGTVAVIDPEPVEALTALLDGHTLAGSPGDMVFASDGRHFDHAGLGTGSLLVDADGSPRPVGREVRPGVWELGSGYVVTPRPTRSFDEADLVLSVAALALVHLVTERPGPGVTALPEAVDAAVAAMVVEVLR